MRNKTPEPAGGFTLVDLLLIVAAIIGLAAIVLPYLARTNQRSPRISCTNHLKQVGLAFRIWAGDNNDKFPTQVSSTNGGAMELAATGNVAAVFLVMSNELSTPKILFCPTDRIRQQATVFASTHPGNTNVSYFVGLDATDTAPNMFLAGDDNFLVGSTRKGDVGGAPARSGILSLTTNTPIAWSETRHEKQGNVGLADGSVQGFSSTALRTALANTGVETNRVVMP